MKIGTMLVDVIRSLFRRPVTQLYPLERQETPERLRGALFWNPENCTGCALCVKECPSEAIELITLDRKAKRFVLRYHVDRCTFCAQCVQNCRFGCLGMSSEAWELAALNREPFMVYFGEDDDVEAVLAGRVESDAEPAAPGA